jgi:hypothetical protein
MLHCIAMRRYRRGRLCKGSPSRGLPARQKFWSACMGRILSRGCRKGPIHILVPEFLCSTWQAVSSPRPTIEWRPARAEAVKDGAQRHPARGSSLDGFEHDGTLERVGDDEVRGELRIGARSFVSHPCMRRGKDPNHDAGIRIGSKLRGGGPILPYGVVGHGLDRDTATSNRHRTTRHKRANGWPKSLGVP